jgi:hypothetical protein
VAHVGQKGTLGFTGCFGNLLRGAGLAYFCSQSLVLGDVFLDREEMGDFAFSVADW